MNIPTPEPSRLAGSISAAKSPASSSTDDASGSAPFAGWLNLGDAGFDPRRAVAAKGRLGKIELSFDTGHVVELALADSDSGSDVLRAWIAGADITSKVRMVSINNP